jgi:uncharacterized protein (DUF697 family)
MAKPNLPQIWKNVQEVDLRPIKDEAETPFHLAIVGAEGVGRRTLMGQLLNDPARPDVRVMTPVHVLTLEESDQLSGPDLIILMVDANASDVSQEQALLNQWIPAGRNVIVFYNKIDLLPEQDAIIPWLEAGRTPLLYGSALAWLNVHAELSPVVLEMFPEQLLAIGRQFPIFREPIAQSLISQTCFSNAVYSFGTGLAEIVPVLDLPLNVADMIVLTKAQAILVYKLGLAFGLSKDWQYYLGEFSGVVGSGFLWRQVARSAVGLIPVWGIVPKVAVAYSGTYVVGHAVLQWYLTGRHVSKEKMAELSRAAFEKGKSMGKNLLKRMPRPKLGKRRPKELPAATGVVCLSCATENETDAKFCKNCGEKI